MKTKKADTIRTDVATYELPSRDAAWAFMRACEAAGLSAGFPSLVSHDIRKPDARTVQVGIKTWMDREAADKISKHWITTHFAPSVIKYAFKGEEAVYA